MRVNCFNKKEMSNKMNRKGIMAVQAASLGLAVCMVIAAGALRPSHIVRRAEQKCAYLGGADCKTQVASMTQAERIEYIRDTVESPSSVWMK